MAGPMDMGGGLGAPADTGMGGMGGGMGGPMAGAGFIRHARMAAHSVSGRHQRPRGSRVGHHKGGRRSSSRKRGNV